jgi:hypothetical protein
MDSAKLYRMKSKIHDLGKVGASHKTNISTYCYTHHSYPTTCDTNSMPSRFFLF